MGAHWAHQLLITAGLFRAREQSSWRNFAYPPLRPHHASVEYFALFVVAIYAESFLECFHDTPPYHAANDSAAAGFTRREFLGGVLTTSILAGGCRPGLWRAGAG